MIHSLRKPGETAIIDLGERKIGEDLFGSYRLSFSGNQGPGSDVPSLMREETGSSGSGTGSYDELETLYSGKIYSIDKQGQEQVFAEFHNKTPEWLSMMEVDVSLDNGSGLPPNIHGIMTRNLSQVKRNFGPRFPGRLFGNIISSIAKLPKNNCVQYFNSVFHELSVIRNNHPQVFIEDVYNAVVQKVTGIRQDNCGGSYDLYLSLEAKVTSKAMDHKLSDDAGTYRSFVKVNLNRK